MYALAASAAGAGVLALSPPVQAKIVYTPANVGLRGYSLDLNHDGITDFTFRGSSTSWSSRFQSALGVSSPPHNAVMGKSGTALQPGVEIGPKRRLWERGVIIERLRWRYNGGHSTTNFYGAWANGAYGKGFKGRYLGLKFLIQGEVHYGWARLDTLGGWPRGAVLTGYAYETIPGKAIVAGQTKGNMDDMEASPDTMNSDDLGSGASLSTPIPDKPQPASLGILALGAKGMLLWRRKESGGTCANI